MAGKIIDLSKYLTDRPKRSRHPAALDDVLVLVVRFLDDEKSSFTYDVMNPAWRNTKTARALLLEALLSVSDNLLSYDDPAVSTELKQEVELAFNRVMYEDELSELRAKILSQSRNLDEKNLKKVFNFINDLLT